MKSPRHHVSLTFLAFTTLLLTFGCDSKPPPETTPTNSSTQALTSTKTATTKSTTTPSESGSEMAGVVVAKSESLPSSPAKLISLAPNITEIVFALGAGDRLVGVTRFCDTPKEATLIPKIGGFIDPDLEAILASKPDLVLGMKSGSKNVVGSLQKNKLSYAFLNMPNIDATYKGIEAIGDLIGKSKEAKDLVKATKTKVHDASVRASAQTSGKAPKMLFVIGHEPLIVAGPNTFGHELGLLAGLENVAKDAKTSYPTYDLERILAIDPDVIIDATMNPKALNKSAAFWKANPKLKAVKNKRVIALTDSMFLRPGPRLGDALSELVKQLYPKAKTP